MDKTKLLISLALSAALAGCGGSDDDDSSGGGNTGGGGSGGGGGGGSSLTLTSADADGVAPCPNQAILTDTAEFAALKTAMQSGTWTFLDLLYNAADADNFKKKCGFEAFWNPAEHTNEVTEAFLGGRANINPTQLLLQGNASICSDNANVVSFVGVGFPAAGTYRHEFKVNHGGMTWHLRTRSTVSGSLAGQSFADASVSPATDASDNSKFTYAVNGTGASHNGLFDAMIGAMTADGTNAPGAEVVLNNPTNAALTMSLDLICATKQ